MAENTAVNAATTAGKARKLLEAMGYAMQEGDEALLSICAAHTEREICNFCNLPSVPEGLESCAANMAAAEFLSTIKAMGRLEGFGGLDLSPALKQLQEGDTNIVYATDGTASPEKRLDHCIAQLADCRKQLVSFRRLKW